MKNIENIDDLLLDSESFHVKDRSKAARRKKAYFKGKKRFDRAYNKGFTPFPKAESIIRGMFRKTNVVKVFMRKTILNSEHLMGLLKGWRLLKINLQNMLWGSHE